MSLAKWRSDAELIRLDFKLEAPVESTAARATRAGRRGADSSSPVFLVDHSACILCDRCVRACDDVRETMLSGETGKGATAGIGFDLNVPMGESTCVKCGECMVSCPTSAITFQPVARVKVLARGRSAAALTAKELTSDPIFAGIHQVPALAARSGDSAATQSRQVLCRQGDPVIQLSSSEVATLKVTIVPKGKRSWLGLTGPIVRRRDPRGCDCW
jgi:ferredoxin